MAFHGGWAYESVAIAHGFVVVGSAGSSMERKFFLWLHFVGFFGVIYLLLFLKKIGLRLFLEKTRPKKRNGLNQGLRTVRPPTAVPSHPHIFDIGLMGFACFISCRIVFDIGLLGFAYLQLAFGWGVFFFHGGWAYGLLPIAHGFGEAIFF